MKKVVISILCIIGLSPSLVHAASASLSVPSSVEVGNTVTAKLTLKETAAWNIKITSAGSTSGCTQSFADSTSNGKNTTKTLTVTCKATSLGIISFTAKGDITNKDGATTNVSTSKKVNVVPVREKSTDATLASLAVEGYELTPAFSKDTLEYSITVPSTVNAVTISAKVNESHASVSGVGTVEVTEGINTFNIVATAENGATKTYVVNVNVEDLNPIEVKIKDKTYTIIKNSKSLPELNMYEEKTIEINGFTIPGFYSDTTGFTLVGVKDESGKVFLAIYDADANKYTLYNELSANALNLYLTDFPNELKGYSKTTETINGVEVVVYKYEQDNRFVLCYGMNIETGKYAYYKYDTEEGTFQIWDNTELENTKKDMETYKMICIAFGVGLLFALILILCLLKKKSKKKNKMKNIEEKKKKEELTIEKIELQNLEKNEEETKEEISKVEDTKTFDTKDKLSQFDRFDIDEKKK